LPFIIVLMTTNRIEPNDTSELLSKNRERFGSRSASYRSSAVHAGGEDLERLVELVAPAQGKRALDIATGAGHVAVALARAGAEVTACDLTPSMLQEAASNLSANEVTAELVLADALNLPFAAASFDIVTSRMAPHHFCDPAKFMAEVFRVLRPGGCFGLQDPAVPTHTEAAATINAYEKLRDPSHVRLLSVEEWKSLAEEAGFSVSHVELIDKEMGFDWWTSVQNASEEVRKELSRLLADGPVEARSWYKTKFRENGLLESFCSPQGILLAVKPL
jgi:ubiquinone/menaquinone biosynthesis C-methylase UbiE